MQSEEDLSAGKGWVHPETHLEYADFTSWFVGEDPIPCWRNAQIARCKEAFRFPELRIRELYDYYTRDGFIHTPGGPACIAG